MLNELQKGQKVLIVGGTSGIGFAAAKAAIAAGAQVTIGSNDEKSLASAAQRIASPNLDVRPVDIMDNHSIESLFATTGPFHHVVLTAASTKVGSIRDLSLEDGYKTMESKFWGAYRIARAAKIETGGSLTLISGMLSAKADPSAVLQGAINSAIEGLVRGLALEFAPTRVNAISPGLIDTPLYASMDPQKREAMMTNAKRDLPVQRVGQAEDIAEAILFALSNPYLTGAVITVDGGASLK